MEVTILGHEIFDHYSDSGILKEEFTCGTENDIHQTPLVLVDVTIKKLSSVQKKDYPRKPRKYINF